MRPAHSQGYCHGHYAQVNLGRPLTPIVPPKPSGVPCEVEGCVREDGRPRLAITDGLCGTHNRRKPVNWLRFVRRRLTRSQPRLLR
jgi:hypothetical protein